MKRTKVIAVVLVVLMMVGALVLASCDKGGEECSYGTCTVNSAACTDSSCAVVKENEKETGRNTDTKCNCE